ncbi:MAG: tetratricopeptide repeat protein [Gemmatimonadales bacterium]
MTTEIEKLERRWEENPLGLTFAPLAEAYRKAGQTGRALEMLDAGLAQHPGYVPAHIVRGRCHLDAEERALAELDFLCVVELDPENVIALQGLADLAEAEGRFSDAIRRLEALLEVDRNNEEARVQFERLRVEYSVAPLSSAELRVRNDAETLRPAPELMPGIENLDIEPHLPSAEAGPESVPQLLEPSLPAPLEEATPVAGEASGVSEVGPVASATSAEPANAELPSAEGRAPSPEPSRTEEPVSEAEPELLVTETMAEIFLRQGYRELALAVYTQLLQKEPANSRIAVQVESLSRELAPTPEPVAEAPAPPPPEPEPPKRYDARSTGGRAVGEFLAGLLAAPRPVPSQAVHPPAFEPVSAPASAPPAPPAPAALTTSAEPTFDEFFAPAAGSAVERSAAPDLGSLEDPRADDAEDLAQFNAWLRGFQRPG